MPANIPASLIPANIPASLIPASLIPANIPASPQIALIAITVACNGALKQQLYYVS